MRDEAKYGAAAGIFAVGAALGLLPWFLARRGSTGGPKKDVIFISMDGFAAGVFLGGGLVHLLDDATERFHDDFELHFPVASSVCGGSMLLLLVLSELTTSFVRGKELPARDGQQPEEKHLLRGSQDVEFDDDVLSSRFSAWTMLTGLVVHSVIEGLSLGIAPSDGDAIAVLIAILSHKGVAAFAFGATLVSAAYSFQSVAKFILLFALATPIGIIAGVQVREHVDDNSASIAVLLAVSAGTFLYVGMFHLVLHSLSKISKLPKGSRESTKFWFLLLLFVGYGAMVVLAIWE